MLAGVGGRLLYGVTRAGPVSAVVPGCGLVAPEPHPTSDAECRDVGCPPSCPALRTCMHSLLIVCFLIAARTRISDNFAAAICLHLRRRPGAPPVTLLTSSKSRPSADPMALDIALVDQAARGSRPNDLN